MKHVFKRLKRVALIIALMLLLTCVRPVGKCFLLEAAGNGNVAATRFLLTLGVDANTRMTGPGEAVIAASIAGHTKTLATLLTHGADPNALINEGETALACAAGYGHTDTVKLLLAHGADPNSGCLELTPLIYARQGSHVEIEKMLIQAGEKQ